MKDIGTIVMVGAGRMGSAILAGWGKEAALKIVVIEKTQAISDIDFAAYAKPLLLVLAVKPQTLESILPEYAKHKAHIDAVITIAAGKKIAFYEGYFGTDMPIYRVMPNLPVVVEMGYSYIVENTAAKESGKNYGKDLFARIGFTNQDDGKEETINAFTGVAGSGPAYLFAVMDAWIKAAEAQGFSREESEKMVRQTVIGSVALHKKMNQSEVVLMSQVASKGGTTQAALDIFAKDSRLDKLFRETIAAAIARAKELE